MKLPRISILGLVAVVVVAALAFGAIRTASAVWLNSLYTLTTALLLMAVVASRFGVRAHRPFWFGFAVFGWGFFALTIRGGQLDVPDPNLPGPRSMVDAKLISSQAILALVSILRADTSSLGQIDEITERTIWVIFLLGTLMVAASGGVLVAWMRRRRTQGRPGPSTSTILTTVIVLGLGLGARAALGPAERPPIRIKVAASDFSDFPREPPVVNLEFGPWSSSLAAMRLPRLGQLAAREAAGKTFYRFLLNPSFEHPICVQVDKTARGATLRAIVLDSRFAIDVGDIAIDHEIDLNPDQWATLERLAARINFWSAPPEIAEGAVDDGVFYTFEGIKDGRYHYINRHDPDPDFEGLRQYLIELSGLTEDVVLPF